MPKAVKIVLLGASFFIWLVACFAWFYEKQSHVEIDQIKNLSNNQIEVIGHGGAGWVSRIDPVNLLPPNSMGSIKKAIELQKADGVEVDLQMTKDGKLWLFHDASLSQTTNGKGCVADNYDERLKKEKYQYGIPLDWFQSEPLVALEELLQYLNQHPNGDQLKLYLDIKYFKNCTDSTTYFERLATAINGSFQKTNRNANNTIILCTHLPFLIEAKRKYPKVASYMLEIHKNIEQGLMMAQQEKFKGVVLSRSLLNRENSKKAHQKGLLVVGFGGKSRSGLSKMIKANPDILQVNNVSRTRRLLLKN